MTDRYAVIGNPVSHSRSPEIHAAFAAQTGQAVDYDRLAAPEDGFREAAADFFAGGGLGLNVTLPFKGDACAFVDTLSERARTAQAVNTIALQPDGRLGDNTDGIGLVRDLRDNHGLALTGQRILLLGAGGASQGVLAPLLELAPARVVVANRTTDKGVALARQFAGDVDVCGVGLDRIGDVAPFDLVINGTAASLSGNLPPLPDATLAAGGATYDMLYAAQPTPFMAWAQAHGAALVRDGFGMLVEQAAESFRLWRGIRPDTRPVIAALHPRE